MVNTIINFEWTGLMGLLLYWLPLAVCAVGYIVRTWVNVQKDLKAREAYNKYEAFREDPKCPENYPYKPAYEPTDTLGTLIGRGVASIIPVVNLICAVCDIAPGFLSRFFETIGDIFSQPLVPKK